MNTAKCQGVIDDDAMYRWRDVTCLDCLGARRMRVPALLLAVLLAGCAAPPYLCLPRTIDDERGFLCVPLERRAPEPEPAALSAPHLYGRPSTVVYELKCES